MNTGDYCGSDPYYHRQSNRKRKKNSSKSRKNKTRQERNTHRSASNGRRGKRYRRRSWSLQNFFTYPKTGETNYLRYAAVMVILTSISIVLFSAVYFSFPLNSITPSTTKREPLAQEFVVETSFFTDNSGFIKDEVMLERGMKEFFVKTGVQPHLYILKEVPEDFDMTSFSSKLYDKLFQDEGHILIVFYEANGCQLHWVCGTQAKKVVNWEAANILKDYIRVYYYSDMTNEEFFSTAFSAAANRIMSRTIPPYVYNIGLIAIASVIECSFVYFVKWYEEESRRVAMIRKRRAAMRKIRAEERELFDKKSVS